MKNTGADSYIFPLPYTDTEFGWKFYALVGTSSTNLPMIQFYQDVKPPSSNFSTNLNVSFRFVVVPTGARMSNIDWTNYDEVKKVLNWID
jgi:hypothetical protein